ncbi:MAG TPA: urease accessory protein UreD [Xanthobacteraceae bacterium]
MSVVPAPENEVFAANRACGRIALAVKADRGVTRRSRIREEGPLRVRCPGQPSAELEAVILNTAGGVAGGDRLNIDISVASEARLVVTTAAAEKIYRALDDDALIAINLKVAAGATLAWLPQEAILFDGARLARTIRIDIDRDARLIIGEAIIFGRLGMGETVRHGRLLDRWQVYREGRIIHAEALRFEGEIGAKLAAAAVTNGGTAIATVLIVPAEESSLIGVRALRFVGEVAASAWKGMLLIRLCAGDGAALRHDLVAVLNAVRSGALPRLWLN